MDLNPESGKVKVGNYLYIQGPYGTADKYIEVTFSELVNYALLRYWLNSQKERSYFTMKALNTKIYLGDKDRFEKPLATREGEHIFEGEKGFMESPLLTIVENQLYQGKKGWFESPIATVEKMKVYAGDRGVWEDPIAVIVGGKVFPGEEGASRWPIATIEPPDVMSAAAAAVLILLPIQR